MSAVASPNTALATQVYNVLKPFLGRYNAPNGADRGKAWTQLETGALSVADGLPAGTKVEGLEAVFGLYPENVEGMWETADVNVVGMLHYPLILKSQGASTWPARVALIEAFPALTTNLARPMSLLPQSDIAWEKLECFIPILTP